ncbi:MAG TPA: histone deacetylase family protein [Candidatus Udaeobacter sp.]|nr:histone deacetylase family protein [Candidatus Udaeobacter sp.]
MIIFHDPSCLEYSAPNHPERPARIARSVPLLKERHPDWEWGIPKAASEAAVLRAHSRNHLERIRNATRDFDADTPVYPKIYEHALRSAGAAIEAAQAALRGERAFSLMRPPGHHATRDRAMGFCYFNNVAFAALDALAIAPSDDAGRPESSTFAKATADMPSPATTEARVERVAIWDFDAHHGNGTEAIVAHNPGIAFASVHQFPGYPGTGTESVANVANYPLGPGTPRSYHVEVARRALDKLVAFKPNLLLVSAGFDAYACDPLVQMTLEPDDFSTFGEWLHQLDIPVATILEGGYSDDLPELIDTFLTAWQS